MNLLDLVLRQSQNAPDAVAIAGPDTCLTYGQLDHLANGFAHALGSLGVRRGDRVGIRLEKSACAIAAMQGVLRLGAIYVPLDPLSPAERIRTIIQDCAMRVVVTLRQREQEIWTSDRSPVVCLCFDPCEPGIHWDELLVFPQPEVREPIFADDIAYILYTSGSTGKPKGVCISHRNALAFVEWASQTVQATTADRFANHAPFHFDLSVFDLYVAFHAGATVSLIPDEVSYLPEQLVSLLIQEAITVWYSVPSVLILMMEQGGWCEHSSLALRAILFAGEPFPIKQLRRLYNHYGPDVRFFNLYGPTETNVCTFSEVMDLPDNWEKSVPIGKACSGDRVWAQKEDGSLVQPGEVGELVVTGPTVMVGYWGQLAQGEKPYATGDLVQLLDSGNYLYIGRRDTRVKVRGYRIELGAIEAVLLEHPAVQETAVTVEGTGLEARLVAFIVTTQNDLPSLLEIKRHCAQRLPRYMVVDEVHAISALPRTRNGKIDRLALLEYT